MHKNIEQSTKQSTINSSIWNIIFQTTHTGTNSAEKTQIYFQI